MPKRDKSNRGRDVAIAKMGAAHMSLSEIAEETKKYDHPVKKSRIHNILQKPDIKELMEKEQQRLATLVPEAVKNYEEWVTNARSYTDRADKDIAFKATTKVLESHGLISGSPSQSIQVLINTGNTIISPVIGELLSGFMNKINSEVFDAEYEDVGENRD